MEYGAKLPGIEGPERGVVAGNAAVYEATPHAPVGEAGQVWPLKQEPRPAAQPQDRREALRSQIERTEHGPNLVVVQLGELAAIVSRDAVRWWWQVPREYSSGNSMSQKDAIKAAEEWLIDEAMKRESEHAESE